MLISGNGKVQVCDYGLNPITSDPAFTTAATQGVAASPRWLAPEIIDPPNKASSKPVAASKSADIFAFAMLALEVFTGNVPFGGVKTESVVVQIANGKRPAKPQAAEQLGLTAEMWEFIERCWTANPNERPTIDEVVRTWEGFVNGCALFRFLPGRRIPARVNARVLVPRVSGRQSQLTETPFVFAEESRESFLP